MMNEQVNDYVHWLKESYDDSICSFAKGYIRMTFSLAPMFIVQTFHMLKKKKRNDNY